MQSKSKREDLLVTPRQKALFKILSESGATEDGEDADGRPFKDAPPYGMTVMLDMTLSSSPDEDELADVLLPGRFPFSGAGPASGAQDPEAHPWRRFGTCLTSA